MPRPTMSNRQTFASKQRRRRPAIALRIFMLTALILGVGLMARRLDFHALKVAFRGASRGLLLLAAASSVAHLWCKAWLWQILLDGKRKVRIGQMFRYTVAAFAASVLTPARAGEVVRLWILRRDHDISYPESASAALTEKYLDGATLLALAAPLPWLVPALPAWAGKLLGGMAVGGLIIVVAAVVASRYLNPRNSIASLFKHLRILRESPTLAWSLVAAVCATVFDLGTLWLCLRALDIHVGFAGAVFVLLVTNAAIAVPTTPGNIGPLEAGAVLGLILLSVPRSEALAFALLYHATQLVPLFGLALINLRLFLGFKTEQFPALDSPRL